MNAAVHGRQAGRKREEATMKLVRSAGILALLVGLLAPVASASAASTVHVRPGQSIQAAINRAPDGALISVAPGTYAGNLEITRPVRLVARGAVIEPAATSTSNFCSEVTGAGAGICVHGTLRIEATADPNQVTVTVTKWLSSVSIEGFTVRGFSGIGILAAGVKGFRAVRDVAAHNAAGGIATEFASDVSLLYNSAHDNGLFGLMVTTSPVAANSVIVGNAVSANTGFGIGFADSLGGRIALNAVHGNCAGIVVMATADTNSPGGSGDVSIQLNAVAANNRLCQPAPGGLQAPYGGIGIALVGAQNTIVALNDVRANVSQAGSIISDGGGIVLLDGKLFGAAAPTGNTIQLNRLTGNGPNDLFGDGSGTANTISGNACTTSNLTGAC